VLVFCALVSLAPTVTIVSPGISVKNLVAEMGRQTGQTLEAGESVADDRLIVRFNQTTPADAMRALAKVEIGKWESDRARIYFERDATELQKMQDAEKAELQQGWERLLEKLEGQMGPAAYDQATARQLGAAYDKLHQRWINGDVKDFVRLEEAKLSQPMGRALVRLLKAIGPERLADIPDDSVEFSTDPTSLQQSLGDDGKAVLETLIQEQDVSSNNQGPELTDATGLKLELNTHAHKPGAVCDLVVFSRTGKILQEYVYPGNLGSAADIDKEDASDKADAADPHWKQLPPLSAELYRVRDERPPKSLILNWWREQPDFKNAILHPEEVGYDSVILGNQAIAMAEDADENLILPQISTLARFLPEGSIKDDKLNVRALRTRLDRSRTTFDLPGWYIVCPSQTNLEYREGQGEVAAPPLGEFSRAVNASDRIELETLAEAAKGSTAAFGLGGNFQLVVGVHEALHSDLPGRGWLTSPMPNLEFYGRLDETQRQAARTEGLALSALTDYNWAPLISHPYMLSGFSLKGRSDGGTGTIFADPFVFFGTVNAKSGTLRIQDSDSTSLQVAGDGWSHFYDPAGYRKFLKGGERENSPPDSFHKGQRRTVKLIFDFDGKASMTLTLQCDDPVGQTYAHFEDLPADLRAEFGKPGS
jgi:hypothetical protein